jgi:hypothetical protein
MMPETVTRVFTKYDSIPDEIEVNIPIPDIETPEFSMKDCYFGHPYRRYAINIGLEGVIFAYYQKLDLSGFIGQIEGTVHWVDKKLMEDKS